MGRSNKKYIIKRKMKKLSGNNSKLNEQSLKPKVVISRENKPRLNNEARRIKSTLNDNVKRIEPKLSKRDKRNQTRNNTKKKPNFINKGDYTKNLDVDFDVAICISSFDRYEKVERILNDLYTSPSVYTFKVFLMNDGSNDDRYTQLKEKYGDLVYLENKVNGGKPLYWKTVSTLWSEVKKYTTHALCQIDDDFIISDYFINHIMDGFFNIKSQDNQYCAFRYHMQDYDSTINYFGSDLQQVDGGTLFDINFIKYIDYSIGEQRIISVMSDSRVWVWLGTQINEYGSRVYVFKKSLAFHDGNDDSKLNSQIRKVRKIYTDNFIDKHKI